MAFLQKIRYIFGNENSDNGYSFLIGDMNIDIIGNINNDYLDMLTELGLKSYINNVYTRLPPKGNSCLDHIFIKTQQSNLIYLKQVSYNHTSLTISLYSL